MTPEHFDQQIAALVQTARRAAQLAGARLSRGRLPSGTAAVTFDDGYADILTEAKPVLERHGCPATMFLTTGAVGGSEGFWWDEVARLILESPRLPDTLAMEIGGKEHRWSLDGALDGRVERHGTATREELHRQLWTLLRPLSPQDRRRALSELAKWTGSPTPDPAEARGLTPEEVRALSEPGYIDIGAHSLTHASLPMLAPTEVHTEIAESKRACEELIGVRVDGFAYPFGDFDAASVASVRDAGFTFACTTEHRQLGSRSEALQLPRWRSETGTETLSSAGWRGA